MICLALISELVISGVQILPCMIRTEIFDV